MGFFIFGMKEEIFVKILEELQRIASALERLSPASAPDYRFSLEDFPTFDWASIGAKIEATDRYGVAVVSWSGHRYKRRSPENSYGASIYFSRCIGKDDQGKNLYERLIKFEEKKLDGVRPVSREIESYIMRDK